MAWQGNGMDTAWERHANGMGKAWYRELAVKGEK
jgi:hypothetical protein